MRGMKYRMEMCFKCREICMVDEEGLGFNQTKGFGGDYVDGKYACGSCLEKIEFEVNKSM